MKFLLHKNLGSLTVNQIGNYLRAHGSGHHWIEKYRGDIFIFVSESCDQAILQDEFATMLDRVEEPDAIRLPIDEPAKSS